MESISILDAGFLVGETVTNPAHFTVLMLFEIPETAGEDYVRQVYERIAANEHYHPAFRKRVTRRRGRFAWDYVDRVDPGYHVRHVTLPGGVDEHGGPAGAAGVGELHAHINRSRTTLLDRSRPLWEADVIGGLSGGRFAIHIKCHHSLIDGIGFLRLLQDCLSADPAADDGVALWNLPNPRSAPVAPTPRAGHPVAARARELGRDVGTIRRTARRDGSLIMPYPNPKVGPGAAGNPHEMTIRSWEFERFDAIRHAVGDVSINDVVVAACGGALRSYLLDLGALPDESLKVMVPIATRTPDEAEGGGNAVGSITANLGTNLTDPIERLQAVHESLASGKALFRSIGDSSGLAWSVANISPIYYNRFFGARRPQRRRRFTTVVSSVAAPRHQLYFNGAALVGLTPVGLVTKGLDLNIALTNTARSLDFGVLTTLPSAQRFIEHYEQALKDLER